MIGLLLISAGLASVVRESRAGPLTVANGPVFRWGMESGLFFLKSCFFAKAFFGACLTPRVFAIPWLGGECDRGSSNMFVGRFQAPGRV